MHSTIALLLAGSAGLSITSASSSSHTPSNLSSFDPTHLLHLQGTSNELEYAQDTLERIGRTVFGGLYGQGETSTSGSGSRLLSFEERWTLAAELDDDEDGEQSIRSENGQEYLGEDVEDEEEENALEDEPEWKPRKLKGRFLHLTDFHPDPHYKAGSSFSEGCHRKSPKHRSLLDAGEGKEGEDAWLKEEKDKGKKGKKEEDVAGKWGSAVSDCDSPMSLVNLTFDWLKAEWADEVDFVVWTGDNARHDIDRSIPRTPKEINELNRMMAGKMREAFGDELPIVPSLGNNDIYPHNILVPGPNAVTNDFSDIWSHFIPSDEYHVFQRGAYFSVEVIPNKLAVISLNTIYWYDANKAVDGCKDGSSEPGALEFDWLEVQLDSFRERGMQVWLTGHVPPHMGHYFDNCYLRYGELALRFQDTIVGHLYGHMNVDHFFFIDVDELESTTGFAPAAKLAAQDSHTMGRAGDTALQQELYKDFGAMPNIKKIKLKDYAVVNVAPSVIPTYLPGVRVFSYNVTGLSLDEEDDFNALKKKKRRNGGHRHKKKKSQKDCNKPEHEDQPHCKFRRKERHFSPDSPSRSNKPLTPLGYAQFYLPEIMKQSKTPPKWKLEYTTYSLDGLLRGGINGTDGDEDGRQPVPWHMLPGYDALDVDKVRRVTALGNGDKQPKEPAEDGGFAEFRKKLKKVTPYRMGDLTIGNWARFARKLADNNDLWKRFASSMYVTGKDNDDN